VSELRPAHSHRALTSTFSAHPKRSEAVVDRLTFNAHIVETGTESWRFKKTMERQQRKGVRRKAG
jgi:hypothetical protein